MKLPLTRNQIAAAMRLHGQMIGWRTTDLALAKLSQSIPGFDAQACLLKAVSVNALYGTQVFSIVRMADHVQEVMRTADISKAGVELVDRLARMLARAGHKPRIFVSFAAKFCHFFVDSGRFPIYDEAARLMLKLHLGEEGYPQSKTEPYQAFWDAFEAVRRAVGVDGRELDRYLWISGMYERWLRQRKKKHVLVNAELQQLFNSPTEAGKRDLDVMLPESFERTFLGTAKAAGNCA
jgi:hypothetical protein